MTLYQSRFSFDHQLVFESQDFILSHSNQDAYNYLMQPDSWHVYGAILVGPSGSGKSHFATLWARNMHAAFYSASQWRPHMLQEMLQHICPIVIDDMDRFDDPEAFFHVLNHQKSHEQALLLTSSCPVSALKTSLPDLNSRLMQLPELPFLAPDDLLMKQLIMKHASDRQLNLPSAVVEFIVARIERSGRSVAKLVERIDHAAIDQRRAITVPFMRELLADSSICTD